MTPDPTRPGTCIGVWLLSRTGKRQCRAKFHKPWVAMGIWMATVEARKLRVDPPLVGHAGELWEMTSCSMYGDYAFCTLTAVGVDAERWER